MCLLNEPLCPVNEPAQLSWSDGGETSPQPDANRRRCGESLWPQYRRREPTAAAAAAVSTEAPLPPVLATSRKLVGLSSHTFMSRMAKQCTQSDEALPVQ